MQPGLLDDDGGILNPFNPKVKKITIFFCQTKNPTTSTTDFHYYTECVTWIGTKVKGSVTIFSPKLQNVLVLVRTQKFSNFELAVEFGRTEL